MAQDITIMGASYSDVPAVELPKTGGGVATFYDMSQDYSWLGIDVEDLGEVYNQSYNLEDTAFNGWTASTTAKTIVSSVNLTARAIDLANYEYWIKWDFDCEIVQNEGATLKATIDRQLGTMWQSVHRRPYGFTNFGTNTDSYNYCTSAFTASSYCIYYNTSGTHTWTSGISYGFYGALVGATLSSTSSLTPNLTIRTPTINARCNTTYFATARASEVDQANSTVKIRGRLFRVKQNSSNTRRFYKEALDIYNNPL